MANPQIEDGYTSIANQIMDALAKIRVPGEARQVLDCILRKTYGWHKKQDMISLTQFEQATGLKRANVIRSLKKLLAMKLIIKGSIKTDTPSINTDTTQIQIYGFNKDFDKWVVVSKLIPSIRSDTRGSIKTPKKVVSEAIHTKDILQKKELKKVALTDIQFLEKIKPTYTWINFDQEMVKIENWILAHPRRKKTRRFIVNWLNKIDKPMEVKSNESDPIERIRKAAQLDRERKSNSTA